MNQDICALIEDGLIAIRDHLRAAETELADFCKGIRRPGRNLDVAERSIAEARAAFVELQDTAGEPPTLRWEALDALTHHSFEMSTAEIRTSRSHPTFAQTALSRTRKQLELIEQSIHDVHAAKAHDPEAPERLQGIVFAAEFEEDNNVSHFPVKGERLHRLRFVCGRYASIATMVFEGEDPDRLFDVTARYDEDPEPVYGSLEDAIAAAREHGEVPPFVATGAFGDGRTYYPEPEPILVTEVGEREWAIGHIATAQVNGQVVRGHAQAALFTVDREVVPFAALVVGDLVIERGDLVI